MTKAEYVYQSLRADIVQGRLQPGTRLVFAHVANRFGVSPIPVREAVRQLETEGLVELKPHTRVEVTPLPWEQGVWAYELRLVLEPTAARQATPFVSEHQLVRMSELLDDMHADLDRSELAAFADHYFAFHDVLFEATPNRTLVTTIVAARETSRRFHQLHRCETIMRGSETALRQVWRLVRWRDAEAVFRAVYAHRLRALENIERLSSLQERRLTAV